jgi:hypothetical protein
VPSFSWYRLRQPRRHIPKRGQRSFQVVDDLLLQHIRRRQVVEIVQAVVLQERWATSGCPITAPRQLKLDDGLKARLEQQVKEADDAV